MRARCGGTSIHSWRDDGNNVGSFNVSGFAGIINGRKGWDYAIPYIRNELRE